MAERLASRVSSPSYQAYQILYVVLTIAPIVAGLDKFTHFLVNWDQYLSPIIEIMCLSPMAYSMTVAAEHLTLANLFFQHFHRCMCSSDNTTNAEALVLSITVVELKACRMVLTTLKTVEFTLISS